MAKGDLPLTKLDPTLTTILVIISLISSCLGCV